MKRTLLILMVACGLALGGRAEAQKGRSFSSGGSSFSRPASSSFGRSYSSGSSSAGKAFSSKPSFSAPRSVATPSFSKPSSGPFTGAKPAKSSGGSFDSGAAAAQRKIESKTAYGAHTSPPVPAPTRPPAAGRTYSAGGSSAPAGRSYSVGKPPSGESYDAKAAAAQRHEESKAAFTKAQYPRPTYTTPQGEARKLDPEDRRVERIRREVDVGRWSMRDERRRVIYVLPQTAPVVVYHDPYSNWFWYWLLARDLDTRAYWAYNYRDQMDAARYRDLLAKDAQLEARIRELEAKKVVRDPAYVPPGVDDDLMYDDGFVEAAVNPQPPAPTVPRTSAPAYRKGPRRPTGTRSWAHWRSSC